MGRSKVPVVTVNALQHCDCKSDTSLLARHDITITYILQRHKVVPTNDVGVCGKKLPCMSINDLQVSCVDEELPVSNCYLFIIIVKIKFVDSITCLLKTAEQYVFQYQW